MNEAKREGCEKVLGWEGEERQAWEEVRRDGAGRGRDGAGRTNRALTQYRKMQDVLSRASPQPLRHKCNL